MNTSTLSSVNFMKGNILLKERTETINIKTKQNMQFYFVLIVWACSFSKMLPYIKFTEDKSLILGN